MKPITLSLQRLSKLMMLLGLLGIIAYFLRQQVGPPMVLGSLAHHAPCVIECPGSSSKAASGRMLCLTGLPAEEELCYFPDDIMLFTIQNGKYILYDYQGEGYYVRENLSEIERTVPNAYPHFYRINKQNLVNMTYARRLDKCQYRLSLAEDFECDIPRNKLKAVENRFYASCPVTNH